MVNCARRLSGQLYSKPASSGEEPNDLRLSRFEIEPFELGRGLWHARFGRADKQPVVIDDVMFSTLNVGLAWPNPDAAVDDAKAAIDRLTKSMVASFGGSRINPQLGHKA